MPPDIDQQDALIVDELRRTCADVIAVYRFGSSVHGTLHCDSDSDIAVLTPRRLPPVGLFELQERLASLIGTDVDLVDLAGASPVLAIQVAGQGRLLYEGEAAARSAYEDRTFSAYARLNEERRGILQRIADEGTIYGR